MERSWNTTYKGHQLALHVIEAGMESDTGVFLATTVCRPVRADGSLGEEIVLEKNYRSIHFGLESACQKALERAQRRVDKLG